MRQFSDEQLKSIAQLFHDLAVNVGQFRLDRIHDGASLEDPGIVQLLGLQWSLLINSSSFYLQAAQVALGDADEAAKQITAATTAANAALQTLDKVDKAINVASAAGLLTAAVMTGDMGQIGPAAKGVYKAIDGP